MCVHTCGWDCSPLIRLNEEHWFISIWFTLLDQNASTREPGCETDTFPLRLWRKRCLTLLLHITPHLPTAVLKGRMEWRRSGNKESVKAKGSADCWRTGRPCMFSSEGRAGQASQDSLHPGPSSGVEEAVYSFYLSLLTSAHRTMSSNFLFFTLVESHSPSVYGVCVCVCVCVSQWVWDRKAGGLKERRRRRRRRRRSIGPDTLGAGYRVRGGSAM